jgi:hypothetical protein
MNKKIHTKFAVASEGMIRDLTSLIQTITHEKFGHLLPKDQLDNYIAHHLTAKKLIADLNSLSNQWLITYIDDHPAGYACLTTKGQRPPALTDKKAMRIAGFGLDRDHTTPESLQALMGKCLAALQSSEIIWINLEAGSPLLPFFEQNGFVRQSTEAQLDELPIPSVYLIRERKG